MNDTPAGAELHADRLHELRREMELRFGGEFVENAVNRLDAASNFLRLSARHRTPSPAAQDGMVDALRKALNLAVMTLAFIGRDQGTTRIEATLDGLCELAKEADPIIRAALASIDVKS